jgi:hypothetical protein
MTVERNECRDCATPGYPCLGSSCPHTHIKVRVCDNCQGEETLYEYEGQELCQDCLLETIPKASETEGFI